MNGSDYILLAEDDDNDVFLMRRAFEDAKVSRALEVVRDGLEAIEYLQLRTQSDPGFLPALVILDLKMPRRTGLDVLEWIREQPILRTLPAVVFSSSARRDDVEKAYRLGANAFIVKPPSVARRMQIARFFDDWLNLTQAPVAVKEGFKAAKEVHQRLG